VQLSEELEDVAMPSAVDELDTTVVE
jgi:hypothetical protein